ncbi:hypothetical protein CDL12_13542 [Handroanthus impetiginosus]|uniref:Uncharacterized protein n=1 Tax=Handroanthus impetiginosus TaxID=429701 RepID=A0A2G9H8I3_9LAMI|nr:hypothetical protein CDL12_13542 [Handroanthus impetiginosus]
MAEKQIKELTELLDKERGRAALEKKNAELEKKKANEALKKVGLEKDKVSEAQKVANVEKKKAEENRLLWENLKVETDRVKSMLALERSNSEAATKKQQELAESNLKKAMFEKNRADDLDRKLEEFRNRAGKLEEFLCKGKLIEGQAGESNTGRNAELANDTQLSQWMGKTPSGKELNIIREKKCTDSEKKKAKKQRKVAEAHKIAAMEQKHRADQLSREVQNYKLRVKELQKELVSYRKYADNEPLRNETDAVKLLKKQLELEKMLVKHAKKASKVEAIRNNMLHQELCHLKQEFFWLQKRLDILDKNFLDDTEAINQLEKIDNQTSPGEPLCSDGYHRQLTSGIDSRLDPPYRGSTQKMLESSAVNSSSASFSDQPLVGSQERGTFSVTTSAKLWEDVSKLKPTMSELPEKTRIRYNEHSAAKADNSRSPSKDNAKKRRVGYRERKRILNAVESIESLYYKGEKLHQRATEKLSLLRGMFNGQKDEPREENLKEDSCEMLVRPSKRRKTSCQGTEVLHLLQDSGEPESILDLDVDHSDTLMRASPPVSDIVKFDRHFKDGTDSAYGSTQCAPQDFDEMATNDYMKLLDLDDAAAESSYRRAIAMPLSPMLPEVEFDGDELEADNPEKLVNRSSQEGLPNIKDNLGSASSLHIIDPEKCLANLGLNGLASSQMQTKEDCVIFLRKMDPVPASDTCFHEAHVSGRKMGTPDTSPSRNEESNTQCEEGLAYSTGGPQKYFVVFSDNRDSCSILRIYQAIGSCMPQCSFLHSAEIFLRSILHDLLKAKDLSTKEKVCVFFSLTLHGISDVGTKNPANVLSDNLVHSLDSLTPHIISALSDPAQRKIFMESCHLFELLAVIEDFLMQRKVWVCDNVSAESEILHSFKVSDAMMLSQVVALPHLLVAGGSLLASICLAVDHVGFVCEMSCNIITMQTFDPVVMLAVLHVFAHVCGSKYFTSKQYSIAMTVVKSVVMFLEKKTSATNSTSLSPSMVGNPSKIWLCSTDCPFSVGALSMEDAAFLLLENLKKHGQSGSSSQDSLGLLKSLVPTVWPYGETTDEVSGPREAAPFASTYDEDSCACIDILSLVEILASVMSWDWTSDHIIGLICEYLESHLMEGFSAAVIVLLGQLGRLGVCASGLDDSGVKKLRGWLSALICQIIFMKLSLPVQFATVNAFFGLAPIKLEEIVDN